MTVDQSQERRVEVIAEAASCHDGSLDKALRLIQVAKDIGAGTVKFQFWSSADRLADLRRVRPEYREIYRRYAMPESWLPILANAADANGLEFLCTAYLIEDLPSIAPYVKQFKVSSFEASDIAFLRALLAYGRPTLVSTGMHSSHNVDMVMIELWRAYRRNTALAFTLLQCTSAYPCPVNAAGIRVISEWLSDGVDKYLYPIAFGFSDHTRSPLAGAVAVGAEASVIEFHLRLDDTDPANPDFSVSPSPDEARIYVENIRQAEVLMGDGEKRVMPEEAPMVAYKRQG